MPRSMYEIRQLSYFNRLKKLDFSTRSELAKETLENGDTLLCSAAKEGDVPFINFLLEECGADVNQQDNSGYTPLMCAASSGEIRPVKSLVEHNAEINVLSDMNAILEACKKERLDIVRYLLDNGADINIADKREGATCLMNSVHTEGMFYLMEHGAIVNAVNDSRETAVHYAIQAICFDSLKTLLNHGADVTISNNNGDDALQTAALIGCWEIADYLISRFYFTPQRRADAYALMASSWVLFPSDFERSLKLWRKSFQIQTEIPIVVSSIPGLGDAEEIRDDNSLSEIADNESAMYVTVLM